MLPEITVYWLPATCVALHVFEEFAWPGGFLAWYRRYRPEFAASLTVRFVVVVNALLILLTLWLGWFGPAASRGVSAWLALMAGLACNGVFHVCGMVLSRAYSPGVVTGVLLYLPVCAWGYWYFLSRGASPQLALISGAVGAGYQLWSAWNHQRRSTPT